MGMDKASSLREPNLLFKPQIKPRGNARRFPQTPTSHPTQRKGGEANCDFEDTRLYDLTRGEMVANC